MFALHRALLPSQCLVCHAWPATAICARCTGRFASPRPRCATCAEPVPEGTVRCGACIAAPPPLDGCVAAVTYEWPWNLCLQQFKFRRDVGLVAALAHLMRDQPGVVETLAQADWLLPIPSSASRIGQRGFNPAALLARHLANPGRCREDILVRSADPPPQRGLGRAERLRNVRGAFAIAAGRQPALRGRAVAVIDDVMTTGATLHEAARVLRRAGAGHVIGLVFARD